MIIYLLRHGRTAGNLEGRYIGTTDEPLCHAGRRELEEKTLPPVQALYVSPMLRCRQSAEILFPGMRQQIVPDFRECDFGSFENKNYRELAGDAAYQAFIDSQGVLPFPGGESRQAFQARCVRAFAEAVHDASARGCETAACVVHGGTIMAVLSACAYPKRGYYDYQTTNGSGYIAELQTPVQSDIRLAIKGEL